MRGKGHTIIESFNGSELVLVLLHEVCEVVEQGCTLGARGVQTPYGLESFVGDLDRGVDVFPSSFSDGSDDFAVGCTPLSVQER